MLSAAGASAEVSEVPGEEKKGVTVDEHLKYFSALNGLFVEKEVCAIAMYVLFRLKFITTILDIKSNLKKPPPQGAII